MKKIILLLIGLATSAATEILMRAPMQQNGHHLFWNILIYVNFLIIIALTIFINILVTKHLCKRTVSRAMESNNEHTGECNNEDYIAPSLPYIQETYTPIIREPNSEPLYNYSNSNTISINEIAYKPKIEPLGESDISLINSIIKNTLNNLSHKYSISALCVDLGNERTFLYRQVKGIYNCTPINLINAIKMAYVAKMLKETRIPIRDIMFKIGMADNAVSFETYFKKYYHTTPYKYREMNMLADTK